MLRSLKFNQLIVVKDFIQQKRGTPRFCCVIMVAYNCYLLNISFIEAIELKTPVASNGI